MSKQNTRAKNKEKITAYKPALFILLVVSMGMAGPIALNIHSAAHILCAVKGECFGEARWLEGISTLPVWSILFATWGALLFVISAISFFIAPYFLGIFQGAFQGMFSMPTLTQIKTSIMICIVLSTLMWVSMTGYGIWLYSGAID